MDRLYDLADSCRRVPPFTESWRYMGNRTLAPDISLYAPSGSEPIESYDECQLLIIARHSSYCSTWAFLVVIQSLALFVAKYRLFELKSTQTPKATTYLHDIGHCVLLKVKTALSVISPKCSLTPTQKGVFPCHAAATLQVSVLILARKPLFHQVGP